jgi:hypothetical protein
MDMFPKQRRKQELAQRRNHMTFQPSGKQVANGISPDCVNARRRLIENEKQVAILVFLISCVHTWRANMQPVFFTCLGVPVNAYTFFLCLSFIIGVLFAVWLDRRSSQPAGLRPDIGAWAFIGAIIGARHFRRPFPGAIFCGYLAGYGVWRGFVRAMVYGAALSKPSGATAPTASPA